MLETDLSVVQGVPSHDVHFAKAVLADAAVVAERGVQ